MTSLSRKKLRTTPRSTRLSRSGSAAVCLFGTLLFAFTTAGTFAADAAAPTVASDPINKIKQRSAAAVWSDLKHKWDNVNSAADDAPSVLDGEAIDVAIEPEQVPVELPLGELDAAAAQTVAARFVAKQPDLQNETPSQPYTGTIRDPAQLKRVTDILPYSDYEPNAEISANDPCENLCPRPDGKPCRVYGDGERVPECPEEVRLSDLPYEGRLQPETVFTWEASNLWSNPLYFEDPQLERYGHTHGHFVQPFISGGRFVTQMMGLPYQMTLHPPCSRRYTLGWYRPGECAPKQIYQIPLNCCAAAVTAGFYTGMVFAIP